MKQQEIKEMATADLRARLAQMEKDYRQLTINHAVTPLDNPAKITADRPQHFFCAEIYVKNASGLFPATKATRQSP